MSQEIIMPKLGLTMTHGKIIKWLKKEGDRVSAGEPVAEIETDKISADVESPADGYILQILAGEGEDRDIITAIAIIGEKDELNAVQGSKSLVGNKMASVSRIFITPAAKMMAKEKNLDYSAIKGTGPNGRIQKADVIKAIEEKMRTSPGSRAAGAEIRISPLARKMAEDNGVDWTKVKGTGPDGRIVKEDVLATMVEKKKPEVHAEESPIAPIKAAVPTFPVVEDRKVPLEGIRKIIAQRLSQSKRDIPHAYFKINVDVGNVMELKNKVSEVMKARTGRKLSLNDIIVKAVATAIEGFPDFNASLVENEIIYYKNANIGIAVNSDRGLVVPVIPNANEKSLSELCSSLGELVDKARSGKLSLEDMTGGTFTVSNLGAYYIDEFSAIINPPESAILAVGRAAETPCVRYGEIVIRPVMSLTLSVDHRIIDGALAAQFMKKLKDILEDPYLILI